MSQQIRQKLPSLGSNLATPLFENASMPKVRQPPRICYRAQAIAARFFLPVAIQALSFESTQKVLDHGNF